MLEDTLRVLPYSLGIVATPALAHAVRVGSWRHKVALAAGWSSALIVLGLVGLLIDLDGGRSARLGGLAIIGAGLFTASASRSVRGTSPERSPIDPVVGASPRPGLRWAGHGARGVLLDRKNLVLAIALGISADNTGGVASAELRNLGVHVVIVSIGVIAAKALGADRPSTASRLLIASGFFVTIDGILILI